jgi:hypothetical protein
MNRKSNTSKAKKRKQFKQCPMLCYQEKLTIPFGFNPKEQEIFEAGL